MFANHAVHIIQTKSIMRLTGSSCFLKTNLEADLIWKINLPMHFQVCAFHDGCKQGINQKIFNRKSISRNKILIVVLSLFFLCCYFSLSTFHS